MPNSIEEIHAEIQRKNNSTVEQFKISFYKNAVIKRKGYAFIKL